MTPEEIKATYDELSGPEAFEAFDAAGLETNDVKAVLGAEVAKDFSGFVYFHVK